MTSSTVVEVSRGVWGWMLISLNLDFVCFHKLRPPAAWWPPLSDLSGTVLKVLYILPTPWYPSIPILSIDPSTYGCYITNISLGSFRDILPFPHNEEFCPSTDQNLKWGLLPSFVSPNSNRRNVKITPDFANSSSSLILKHCKVLSILLTYIIFVNFLHRQHKLILNLDNYILQFSRHILILCLVVHSHRMSQSVPPCCPLLLIVSSLFIWYLSNIFVECTSDVTQMLEKTFI